MECVGTIVSASKHGVVTNGLVHRRSSNIKKIDALLIKIKKLTEVRTCVIVKAGFILSAFLCKYNSSGRGCSVKLYQFI